MGGDHKCPVCQATFTRPQHVARHMRSHTGDRPYKCQFCGDQFARSDLLSRHVNKCHANEKPLANPSTRRKGSASASRATTSKQACDQCVQSSLPCDGSNPCAKCVQRKARCTYVKFHRQTAPVGPGHKPASLAQPSGSMVTASGSNIGPSHSPTTSSSSRYPIYPEDLMLSSSSAAAAPPSSYGAQAAIHEALYPQSATAPSFGYGSMYSASSSSASAADMEYAAARRGQHQDDLYRSSSLPPGSNTSWPASAGWPSSSQESYHSQSSHSHHHPHSQTTVERHAYQQPHTLAPHQQHDGTTSGLPVYLRGGGGGGDGSPSHEILPPGAGAPAAAAAPALFKEIFSEEFGGGPAARQRRARGGSISDGYLDNTDSGSENGYYSAGSFRGRKERVYLDGLEQSPFSFDPHHHRSGSSSSSSARHHRQHIDRPGTASSTSSSTGPPPGSSSGGGAFFGAFGSMSLDDQNMLAELAAAAGQQRAESDGSPFFSNLDNGAVPFPSSASAAGAGSTHPSVGRRAGAALIGSERGGDNAADPNATPMPIKEEESLGGVGGRERALRMVEGPRIHRPLSSLAALPPSSVQDLNWSSYLGLGTPGGGLSGWSGHSAGLPGGSGAGALAQQPFGGWTPGGNVASYAASLAGLGDSASGSGFATGVTPGKEMDPKELREFWKQYLRTPLTGPETVTATEDSESKMLGAGAGAGVDGGMSTPHRRPRVTSMPSSNKTPIAGERDRLYAAYPNESSYHRTQSQQSGSIGSLSSMRTTLHPRDEANARKEDLASYEAAVLARKTPMNLNMGRLSTRRKGGAGGGISPGVGSSQLSKTSSVGENMTTVSTMTRDRSMSEASNASSTAVNPYGGPDQRPSSNAARELMMLHQSSSHHYHPQFQNRNAGSDESTSGSGSGDASPASRASSLGVDATMESLSRPTSSAGFNSGAYGQQLHPQRPSAKRLASSVLESDNPKAMKYDGAVSSMSPEVSAMVVDATAAPPIALQPPPLGSLASLPPLSTQSMEGPKGGSSAHAMMAPPPPSSAPPQSNSNNSLLALNLPVRNGNRITLAERRRMGIAAANATAGLGEVEFGAKQRRLSDAH